MDAMISSASSSSLETAEVELVTLIAPDGSIRSSTRSVLPSLITNEDDDDDGKEATAAVSVSEDAAAMPTTNSQKNLPSLVDEVAPSLVRLHNEEESSDSEESDGSIDVHEVRKSCSNGGVTRFHDKVQGGTTICESPVLSVDAAIAATSANNHSLVTVPQPEDGAVGPYDCLSDQFTNLFCSVVLCAQTPVTNSNGTTTPGAGGTSTSTTTAMTTSQTNNAATATVCADEGCSAYPLPDFYDEADFGFASMPLFLSRILSDATGKQDEFSISIPDRPHNRSSGVGGGPKQRLKHLEGIWKTWHAATDQEDNIPILERSKSLPEKLAPPIPQSKSTYFYYHGMPDPEQDDLGYDSDPELDCPHRKMQRSKNMSTTPEPQEHPFSEKETLSYRDHRPPSIDTTVEMMTPTIKTLNEESSMYQPPPPPPAACRHGFDDDGVDDDDDVVVTKFTFDGDHGTKSKRRDSKTKLRPSRDDSSHGLRPTRRLRAGLDPYNATGPSFKDLMTPEGEMFLRTFIHEATNTKIPIIWHRRSNGSSHLNDSLMALSSSASSCPIRRSLPPMAVTCTFEVGAHLDQVVVQPKFTWCPTHEPHLDQHRIRLSGGEPHSIELLSIIRVVQPRFLNRDIYPFARLDRTLCITTNDEAFDYLVLEAESTRARDWLVNALKMIVARLASIIIVRDEAMLLDFFTPFAELIHLEEQQEAEARAEEQVLRDHRQYDRYSPDYDGSDSETEKPSHGHGYHAAVVDTTGNPTSTFAASGEQHIVSPTIQPTFGNGEFKLVSYATGR